jgi:SAM-dependent methyltransferase
MTWLKVTRQTWMLLSTVVINMGIQTKVKRLIPPPLLRMRHRWMLANIRRRYGKMTTEEAFSEIYRRRLWGSGSGTGSEERYSKAYCDFVVRFALERRVKRVVDIGCGDFSVGRRIAEAGFEYIGVDVVPEVIQGLQCQFGRKGVTFLRLDAITENPPAADLCLIRQVLQHLSNAEIVRVLDNCRHYPQVLVTEHLPMGGNIIPNKDKPHGPDTRVYDNSGVFLDEPPFSLPIEIMLEVPYIHGEVLRSVLIPSRRVAAGVNCTKPGL